MDTRLLLSLSLLLGFSPLAPGATVSLSLDATARHAIQHNPDLAAARWRIAEAKGRLIQSGRLANPEIEFEYADNPRSSELNTGVSFTQKFPLTARLRQEKTLSQHQFAQAEAEVRDQERKLVGEVQAGAVKLLALDRQRELMEAQAKNAATLTEAVEKRTRAGEISPTDAAQLAIEGQHGLLELQQLKGQRAALLGELKPMLGIPVQDELHLTGSLPAIRVPSATASGSARPDLQASLIAEQAAQSEADLARSSRWEDLSVGVTFEREHMTDDPTGLEKENFIGFRLSMPLPLWNNQKGLITEKEAARQRAILETQALQARIRGEAAAARQEMASHARLYSDTHANLIPAITRHTETIENAYNKGEADLLTLLRSREQRLHAETAALEALRDYHLARVRYESATATQPGARTTTTTGSGK